MGTPSEWDNPRHTVEVLGFIFFIFTIFLISHVFLVFYPAGGIVEYIPVNTFLY